MSCVFVLLSNVIPSISAVDSMHSHLRTLQIAPSYIISFFLLLDHSYLHRNMLFSPILEENHKNLFNSFIEIQLICPFKVYNSLFSGVIRIAQPFSDSNFRVFLFYPQKSDLSAVTSHIPSLSSRIQLLIYFLPL